MIRANPLNPKDLVRNDPETVVDTKYADLIVAEERLRVPGAKCRPLVPELAQKKGAP
jgi:hypothetical protein